MVIRSYNDHCSAPFSRALVGWHHQSLLGRGSRHCYGINYTKNYTAVCLPSPTSSGCSKNSSFRNRSVLHSDMSNCVRRGIVRLFLPEFTKPSALASRAGGVPGLSLNSKLLLSAEWLMRERNVNLLV